MVLDQPALPESWRCSRRVATDSELMRRLLGAMLQERIAAGATAHIGGGLHAPSEARTIERNGTRAQAGHDGGGRPHGQDPEDPDRVKPLCGREPPPRTQLAASGGNGLLLTT